MDFTYAHSTTTDELERQAVVPSEPESIRVLLVDDSHAIRSLMEVMLKEIAADTMALVLDTAASGEQALEMAGMHAYDVIFMDVEMPGMGGLAACEAIKKHCDTRVVMLSSLDSGDAYQAGRHAGCDNYLCKPPNYVDVRVIMRLVRTRKLLQ